MKSPTGAMKGPHLNLKARWPSTAPSETPSLRAAGGLNIAGDASPFHTLRCPQAQAFLYLFIWPRDFLHFPSNLPQSLTDGGRAGATDGAAAPLSHVPPCFTGSGALSWRRPRSALRSQQHCQLGLHTQAGSLNKPCACCSNTQPADPCVWPQQPVLLVRLGFWHWFSHFCSLN